jgi:hypothetical protein
MELKSRSFTSKEPHVAREPQVADPCTRPQMQSILYARNYKNFLSCASTAQFWALAASVKLSVSFQLLDLGQSSGLLGRVISSSQGLC